MFKATLNWLEKNAKVSTKLFTPTVLSYHHNQHLFANNRCLSVISTQFIYSSSSNLLVKGFKRVEQWINRTKSFSGKCSINPLFDEHDRTSINNQWMVLCSFSKRNESNKYLIEHNPFLVFVRLITCSTNTTGRKILLIRFMHFQSLFSITAKNKETNSVTGLNKSNTE